MWYQECKSGIKQSIFFSWLIPPMVSKRFNTCVWGFRIGPLADFRTTAVIESQLALLIANNWMHVLPKSLIQWIYNWNFSFLNYSLKTYWYREIYLLELGQLSQSKRWNHQLWFLCQVYIDYLCRCVRNLLILYPLLTHPGRVTHICVSNLTIIGSDNGLSPGRLQTIIWINAGILWIALNVVVWV